MKLVEMLSRFLNFYIRRLMTFEIVFRIVFYEFWLRSTCLEDSPETYVHGQHFACLMIKSHKYQKFDFGGVSGV